MKRALAICAAMLMFGVASFGFSISGTWSTDLELLPELVFDRTTLTLTLSYGDFDITSSSRFTAAGYTAQTFRLAGAVAFVDVSGLMVFDPMAVAYRRAHLTLGMDLFGLDIGVAWYHGTGWNAFDPGMFSLMWPTVRDPYFHLGHLGFLGPKESAIVFDFGFDPFKAQLVLLDKHYYIYDDDVLLYELNMIGFHKFVAQMEAMPLCCGLDFTITMTFLKHGFDNLSVRVPGAIDLGALGAYGFIITYAVDSKTIELIPPLVPPFVTVCPRVYFNAGSDLTLGLAGFEITCELDECNYITFGTALPFFDRVLFADGEEYYFYYTPSAGTLGWADDFDGVPDDAVPYDSDTDPDLMYYFSWTIDGDVMQPFAYMPPAAWGWDLTSGYAHYFEDEAPFEHIISYYFYEWEFVELGFCGPGCCGPDWEAALSFFWGDAYEITFEEVGVIDVADYPTLFGLSRIKFEASIPIMENLAVEFAFSHYLYTFLEDPTSLTVGWTFTF